MLIRLSLFTLLSLISFFPLSLCADYYKLLEISRDASEKDISKAFKRLSLQYHPDRNPGNEEAANKFIELNRAHEVLTDADLRRIYDTQGEDGLERHAKGGGETDMWGNRRRGPNMSADIRVSLEDLYNGAARQTTFHRNIICTSCRGTGAKDGITKVCQYCQGKGVRMEKVSMGIGFTMQMQTTCQYCGGHGKTHAEVCPQCRGKKVNQAQKELRIEIERGMRDGQKIVFEREAEQHPDFSPGDVVLTLKQEPHPRFKRIGNNLYYDCPVPLKEALLGFSKTVRHLDHHFTAISSKEPVQPFSVKVIKGEGMPVHNEPDTTGDMHVKFKVNIPTQLSTKDIELLEKIFDLDPK